MSERTALGATMETMTLEEPGGEQASPRAPGPLRCGPCAVWPRQQTWLCVVPLLMGFVGLGLSLMLLKWIVVGSVQDYVPTDLVDANRIGQDPIFLSKPSALPKGAEGSVSTTPSVSPGSVTRAAEDTETGQRTRIGQSTNNTASRSSSSGGGVLVGGPGNRAPHHNRVGTRVTNTTIATRAPPEGKEVTPRSTNVRKPTGDGASRSPSPSERAGPPSTTSTTTITIIKSTSTAQPTLPTSTLASPSKPGQRWNHGRSPKGPSTKPTRPHHRFRTPPVGKVYHKIIHKIKDRNPFSSLSWEAGEAFGCGMRDVAPAATATRLSPDTGNRKSHIGEALFVSDMSVNHQHETHSLVCSSSPFVSNNPWPWPAAFRPKTTFARLLNNKSENYESLGLIDLSYTEGFST
ncbi:hypothetical protein DNTS_003383 [Danionella cerebrum]|uniref:Uncharacterized protein n=1 Tax=Danionella cerebrum TaxID=2873325 RepID=A0A553RAN3_9TELE|nr:hypothetical protein DNTS_003383 [Danionella translucida]